MSEDARRERGRKALPCSLTWVAEAVAQNLVVRQPEDREEEPPVVTVEAEDRVVTADGLVEALGVIGDLTRGASGDPTLEAVRVARAALVVQEGLVVPAAETTQRITKKMMRNDQVGAKQRMIQTTFVWRSVRY